MRRLRSTLFLIFGGIFMTEKNFDAQERVFNLLRELAENKKTNYICRFISNRVDKKL